MADWLGQPDTPETGGQNQKRVRYFTWTAQAAKRRPRTCLDPKFSPKFHYKKEDFSSHQNIGKYMEY
jgi:hypothetical protein